MSNAINVRHWLTDLDFQSEQSFVAHGQATCPTPKNTDSAYTVNYEVYENPGADPEHRFVYIKTISDDNRPDYRLYVTFSWLKHVSAIRDETNVVPLSPDEASFWKSAGSMPSGISVIEDEQPSQTAWETQTNPSPTPQKITIKDLGYELRNTFLFHRREGDILVPQLYRDGRPLLDYFVTHTSDVYTFQAKSGRITAFVVEVDAGNGREHFLIQNDAIRVWDSSELDSLFKPILYDEQLLWLNAQGGRVNVKNSKGDIICTFKRNERPMDYPKFRTWDGHWILELDDFVVQDGEVLNQKFGFQEVFNWGLINNKPVYFFRKGARVGISYDGQILPLQYEDVTHGFMCCGSPPNGDQIYVKV